MWISRLDMCTVITNLPKYGTSPAEAPSLEICHTLQVPRKLMRHIFLCWCMSGNSPVISSGRKATYQPGNTVSPFLHTTVSLQLFAWSWPFRLRLGLNFSFVGLSFNSTPGAILVGRIVGSLVTCWKDSARALVDSAFCWRTNSIYYCRSNPGTIRPTYCIYRSLFQSINFISDHIGTRLVNVVLSHVGEERATTVNTLSWRNRT